MNAPTLTADDVIRTICANTKRGTPSRRWEVMTPTRYAHMAELLREGKAGPAAVLEAESRVNASRWLNKPALEVTAADVDQLLIEKPWEALHG